MKVSVENALHGIGEHPEILGAARDVDVARQRSRLAGVQTLGGEKFVETVEDAVGDLGEHIGALGDGHLAPGAFERRFGGAAGGVDFRPPAFRDAANNGVVERRAVLPAFAGRPLSERSVDEMRGVFTRAV